MSPSDDHHTPPELAGGHKHCLGSHAACIACKFSTFNTWKCRMTPMCTGSVHSVRPMVMESAHKSFCNHSLNDDKELTAFVWGSNILPACPNPPLHSPCPLCPTRLESLKLTMGSRWHVPPSCVVLATANEWEVAHL